MSDAIRCDGCGEYEDRPKPWGGYMQGGQPVHAWHNVPAGWVHLSARQYPHDISAVSADDAQGEFCGWPCAARWLNNYVATRTTREPV